ncbi:MAG: hypothetical protein IJX69_05145 [Oscillospiraceae bacterium]|nr:hypothetical protein [Oscillospiraceae bacterium]
MKKILALLLVIAVLCLAGCDRDEPAERPDSDRDTNRNEHVEADRDTDRDEHVEADRDDSDEDEVPPTTEDPYAGWIQVFGYIYIPNLPFEDWEVQNQDNISCITVFIESRDSEAFHAYAQSLPDFGYTIEQTEPNYYRGTDPEGRRISLFDPENGFMQISIYYN